MRKRKDENQHRAGAWPDAHRKNDSGDLTPRHGACDVARIDDVIAGFAKAMIVAMVMAVMVMVTVASGELSTPSKVVKVNVSTPLTLSLGV